MKIKPLVVFGVIALTVILATFFSIRSFQTEDLGSGQENLLSFRQAKNLVLRSKVGAPFYNNPAFDSLRYFPNNQKETYSSEFFSVTEGESLDLMPDRVGYASHKIAGYVILEKETWRDTLYLLKDLDEKTDTLFFAPFTDASNGKSTYGGGRYLDVIVKSGKVVSLDFNYAYNPYCAYNIEYVCAKIPSFNRLNKAIEAGEKTY